MIYLKIFADIAAEKGSINSIMRLIIVRHGDPDYEHDTLTAQGHREAQLAAERLSRLEIAAFYVSPLGRALLSKLLSALKKSRFFLRNLHIFSLV